MQMSRSKTSSRRAEINRIVREEVAAFGACDGGAGASLYLAKSPMFANSSCGPSSSKPTGDKFYPDWSPNCQKNNGVRDVMPALMIREAYQAAHVRTAGLIRLMDAVLVPRAVATPVATPVAARVAEAEAEARVNAKISEGSSDTMKMLRLLGAEALFLFAKEFLTETELETLKTEVWDNAIASNGQPEDIKLEQLSEVIGIASNLAKEQTQGLGSSAPIALENVVEKALKIAKDSKLLSEERLSLDSIPREATPADVKEFGPARLRQALEQQSLSLTPPSSGSDLTASVRKPALRGSSKPTESTYSILNPLKRFVGWFAEKETPKKSLPAPEVPLSDFESKNPFSLDSSSGTMGSLLSSGLAGPSISNAAFTSVVASLILGMTSPGKMGNLLPFAAAAPTLPAFANILGQVQQQLVYAYA